MREAVRGDAVEVEVVADGGDEARVLRHGARRDLLRVMDRIAPTRAIIEAHAEEEGRHREKRRGEESHEC